MRLANIATVLVHGRNELHLKFNNDADLRAAYTEITERMEKPSPVMHDQHIAEYPGDVFVIFDPLDGGASILGAERTLEEARRVLNRCAESIYKPLEVDKGPI